MNHVPWGAKGINWPREIGLSYPKGATMFSREQEA